MAITNFIPTVWAGGILREMRRNQTWVQPGVVNRNYEGEIRDKGDTVKINSLGDITVFDYNKNTDMNPPEILTDSSQNLTIDQSKAFNFYVDDIDQVQSNTDLMSEATEKAGNALNDVSASYVSGLTTGADPQNTLGSASSPITTLDKNNVYEFIVELGKRMNDSDVPTNGRYIQAPSWLEALILNAEIINKVDPQSMIRNGVIGRVGGFDIISASTYPTATDGTAGNSDIVVAGHAIGLSFAEQIVQVKGYEPEKRFGDAVKGLHVYGAKLTRPEAFAIAYCQATSGSFASA